MHLVEVSENMPTQIHNEPLDELAEQCGLVSEYTDVFGTKRTTSPETKKAVLRAMHLSIDRPEKAQQAVDDRRVRTWMRMLEPTMVFSVHEQPITIPIHLPVQEGEEPKVSISGTLTDEQGRRKTFSLSGREIAASKHQVIDGIRYVRFSCSPGFDLEMGYYALTVTGSQGGPGTTRHGAATIIITPDASYIPPELRTGRAWGLSLNLYAIRSSRNWGIGDFTDLKEIVRWIAGLGGSFVGINPLHALANTRPFNISPYSPISRLYQNAIYLDIEGIPDIRDSEEGLRMLESDSFRQRIALLREADVIDYDAVGALKEELLRHAFAAFYELHYKRNTGRGNAFRAYVDEEGAALALFSLFLALREHLGTTQGLFSWQEWPEEYQSPDRDAVLRMKEERKNDILFYQYQQWLVSEQLDEITAESRQRGMSLGLYLDLAIGSNGGGSDVWNHREAIGAAAVGAPPDTFSPTGQDWGFPPMIPEKMKETGYELFIETMRKNMRYGGALRIDHALALFRLYWVPHGMSPADGAYVRYPARDLLRITALESVRNKCMVIAEDLGTVPREVKQELQKQHMLSYRLLYFERNYPEPSFVLPEQYPAMALCAVTTHDLPTLAGYWAGRDIEQRRELGKYPDDAVARQEQAERQRDKMLILKALKLRGLLPETFPGEPDGVPEMTPELCAAIYRYLASTPCKLLAVSLDDLLGTMDQQNMPGTIDEYPNWMQKTSLELEEMVSDRRFADMFSMLTKSFA